MSEVQPRAGLLAALPNGEAVRPEEVRRILIEPAAAPPSLEGQRFKLVLHLTDGTQRVVASSLTRADAADLGRRCARALNDAARTQP